MLTDKQEKYVQGLIEGKSQREAYKTAYNAENMSDKTIDEEASKLFASPKISARYNEIHDRLIKETEDECIIDAKAVLKELATIATADIADYAKITKIEGKQLVALAQTDDIPLAKRKAIAGIKQGRSGVEVKLNDKMKALELLGRHLGMFNDKLDMNTTGDFKVTVEYVDDN